MKHIHPESRKKFQIDRLILFTDAVFAIAITLLILEIKVPELEHEHLTEQIFVDSLVVLIPKFMGFIVSFLLIGLYWTVHHRIFAFVVDYDYRLLWLNLCYLFFIVLLPFTTAFYSEYVFTLANTPFMLYCANFIAIGVFNLLLWHHISNPHNNLSEGLGNKMLVKYYYTRSITVPSIFILLMIAYLFAPMYAIIVPPLIPFIMLGVKRYFSKRVSTAEMNK